MSTLALQVAQMPPMSFVRVIAQRGWTSTHQEDKTLQGWSRADAGRVSDSQLAFPHHMDHPAYAQMLAESIECFARCEDVAVSEVLAAALTPLRPRAPRLEADHL